MFIERILESHHAHTDRAMFQIGVFGLIHRVVVDIDDVIEHSYGCGNRLLQLFLIETVLIDMVDQIHRSQVTDGNFVLTGVQGDLCAQVRRMYGAYMLLW